jgi:hypothetical protein
MAIQFPPINAGDPLPNDGDTYLYLITQEEFVYNQQDNSWTPQGVINNNAFGYYGPVFVQQPAPVAQTGWIYSVADGGTAAQIDPSFVGIAGVTDVDQWNLIIFDGTNWQVVATPAGPWLRTAGGQITPVVDGDDLNLLTGNYNLDVLPEI